MESSDEKRPFWKRFRIPTWLMLIWSALMWIWILSTCGSAASQMEECQGQAYSEACEAGTTIGAGLAGTFMFGLWFMGLIILFIIWFMTRPKT